MRVKGPICPVCSRPFDFWNARIFSLVLRSGIFSRHTLRYLLNAFIKNLKPFFSYKKFDGSERKSQIAPLLILFSMVLIPFVAFTPWFIWYIMPLLLSYLWFTNAQLSPGKVSKYLYLTVFVTNSLNYFIYSDQLGSIYISSFIVRPILLNTLFALAALTLWFQVPRFVNSYSKNLSTK